VPELRQRVSALIDSGEVDLCISDFLFAATNVPRDGNVPVVLFEHNVEYLIWKRLSAVERSPWRRALLEIEWRKLRAQEARACLQSHTTIAVSEDDRRRLEEIAPGSRVTSVPTGVDTDYFNPAGYPITPNRLVFSGSMDWHPNEDAVIYFVDAILPRIRAEIPDVSFSIVGRNPGVRVRELARHAGVEVTGTVDDVRPHIAAGSVYVVPLRAGSGTRLKIFEALAMARPVVSTTVGAEGLVLEAGRQFVAADDPGEFADAVVALLRDPERRLALGDAGRTLVETHYSWPTIGCEFERLCEEALAHHAYAPELADSRAYLPRAGSSRPRGARVVAGEHGQIGWSHPHP
jgi:glycosyltransferase involved in cell wall biosynthesis